ncbi:MAG: hypothetical protein ABJL99_13585 [Aliishimia sp.]
MRFLGYFFLSLLMSGPVFADHEWAQFFETPNAAIERGTDATGRATETVRLPGDVQILRRKDDAGWRYTGVDFSDNGAVGCVALILVEFQRIATKCDGSTTVEQTKNLRGKLERMATFYEENAVPAKTAAAFMADTQAEIDNKGPFVCADISPDILVLRDSILAPDSAFSMDDLLAVPRLPVTNPCF